MPDRLARLSTVQPRNDGGHTPHAAAAGCRASRRRAQGGGGRRAPRLAARAVLPALGLAPVAVAAHRWSPWAWRAGCVSRRPGPGLPGWLLLWFVGVSCGFVLCAVFPVSGGGRLRKRKKSYAKPVAAAVAA